MNPPLARIVVLGATGIFGQRPARRLVEWPDASVVLAARGRAALEVLRRTLEADGAANPVEVAVLDRQSPAGLEDLRPWAIVDCAGPFQASDYRLAKAALEARAHYLDLADGRAFVAGFVSIVDEPARLAGLCAVTGASSSPALSHAAIARVTRGWRGVDRIEAAIAPGARAPRGKSVVRAALSWVGRPVRVFVAGEWRSRPGWGLLRRAEMVGLGSRWLSLAETPDLDVQVEAFQPRRDALFLAGLEMSAEHLGLWLLSWLVRVGLMRNLEPLAGILPKLSAPISRFGSDRGGMSVIVQGLDADGEPAIGRWSLCAEAGQGPFVPILPAAAVLRAWLDGRADPGATVCAGLVDLDSIMQQGEGLSIRTSLQFSSPADRSLTRRLLGAAFDELPRAV
ncbi:MAG TPA: saccharopine dehydrogenase, partial [Caulobacteraceae bacterium]